MRTASHCTSTLSEYTLSFYSSLQNVSSLYIPMHFNCMHTMAMEGLCMLSL